jgi:hypothetical protein
LEIELAMDEAMAEAQADSAVAKIAMKASAVDEFQRRLRLTLVCKQVPKAAKAARLADALDSSFNKQWLRCRHLALIVEVFRKLGSKKRTDKFGTYRVDLVVQLFERLVDRHNFDLVLRLLKAEEVASVTARIGWLNFFCPLKPEGCLELNLAIYEERLIAKMINTLATVEPGDNWPRKQFRWKHSDEPMPGWELKLTWMEDLPNGAGLPERGYMCVEYYAGEGKRLRGCAPHTKLRRAMLHLVNMGEDGVVPESGGDQGTAVGGGGKGEDGGDDKLAKEGVAAMASASASTAGVTKGKDGKAVKAPSPGIVYIQQNEVNWRKYLLV